MMPAVAVVFPQMHTEPAVDQYGEKQLVGMGVLNPAQASRSHIIESLLRRSGKGDVLQVGASLERIVLEETLYLRG